MSILPWTKTRKRLKETRVGVEIDEFFYEFVLMAQPLEESSGRGKEGRSRAKVYCVILLVVVDGRLS